MKSKTQSLPHQSFLPPATLPEEAKANHQRIIKLKNIIQRQHTAFLSQTATQDLILERIINKLTLLSPPLAPDNTGADWHSAIHFCIQEMSVILESHGREREGWKVAMEELLEQSRIEIHPQCQASRENCSLMAFQPMGLGEQMCGRATSLQRLQVEVEELDRRYEQILLQNQAIKLQCKKLETIYSQSTKKNQQYQSRLRQFSVQNAVFMKELKQSKNELKQSRNLSMKLYSSKLETLQRENQRLADTQSRAFANQLQLSKIIDENEREIYRVHEEVHRLNLQVIGFQLKCKEMMERDVRGKITADYRPKRQESKILCEIPTQNTIDSVQSKTSKRQLQKMRKLKLQSVQEKLSSYNSLA